MGNEELAGTCAFDVRKLSCANLQSHEFLEDSAQIILATIQKAVKPLQDKYSDTLGKLATVADVAAKRTVQIAMLESECADLKAEKERLRAALGHYGQHYTECPGRYCVPHCICGYSKSLHPATQPAEGE